ncbi:hypothetical protein [Nocardia asteroides]|uniref:hypothetical protein n=1 Tax=Nocardia asteroides TaxID=1824 RepID=UPI001E3B01F8|nr:hypothetical protein [Nocardia asteroides]UGT64626.1 hypothetical protein LTT61_15670 [Nocardia asteroides]
MVDRSTPATFEVSEADQADLADQSRPVAPDDDAPPPEVPGDLWSADPADVVEQRIEVPLDDERE